MTAVLDFDRYEVLSFDCYGTLIDWEKGILSALRPVLKARGVELDDEALLTLYADLEAKAEQGDFIPYRAVLRQVMAGLDERLGLALTPVEHNHLGDTLKDWPAFPDAPGALAALKRHYKLAIISNVDDDLFAESNKHLGVAFDWVISAQLVQNYKPALRHFEVASKMFGVGLKKQLHVAQSLYHDIGPANRLGLDCVWINRRHGKSGSGATPLASGTPDLEMPDLESLVALMGVGAL
jgi:2-haloacid dehalogenase